MSFYDDMASVTEDVMKEFKQGVIEYISITPGNGPIDDPGPPTETTLTLDGAANGVKFKYVQNGFAVASDLQIVSSTKAVDTSGTSVSFNPDAKGFVRIDGIRYKIVKILPKPAAGTPVAYLMIVRK